MAKLLFRLNGVEEDEADEVRALLNEADLDYYETDAGRWRISVAAIWLKDEAEFERARQLIEQHQRERQARIRQQPIQSFWQRSKERPMDLFFALLAMIFVVGLMLWPFFNF